MAKLGRNPKPITREQLLAAMKMTKSNMACARYLGISYMHYSRYAKSYIDEETGKTLFDLHKNQSGKGIRKFLGGKDLDLEALMSGELFVKSLNVNRYKDKLIQEFQNELKKKDDQYSKTLKQQGEDVKILVAKMREQYFALRDQSLK